jgi:hypothetical protein
MLNIVEEYASNLEIKFNSSKKMNLTNSFLLKNEKLIMSKKWVVSSDFEFYFFGLMLSFVLSSVVGLGNDLIKMIIKNY